MLVRNDPRDVPRIIRLSRVSYRKMVQNLWWATGYNVIAIPLAAGVLAYEGIVLSPAASRITSASSATATISAVARAAATGGDVHHARHPLGNVNGADVREGTRARECPRK